MYHEVNIEDISVLLILSQFDQSILFACILIFFLCGVVILIITEPEINLPPLLLIHDLPKSRHYNFFTIEQVFLL